MFKLPDGIGLPRTNVRFAQQGRGSNRFSVVVDASTRIVSIGRYGTTSCINVPADAWLTVCLTYIVAD